MILLLLISFGSVGAVLFTPALPAIKEAFGVGDGQAQLTVTFYLIGYAIGQLPYGPLGNAIGRRKTIYVGCLLGVIGSLMCALTTTFWVLNAGRFIMALGMCVGLVMAFTIVADLYPANRARKVLSYLLLSFAFTPALATMVGGFLTTYLGWRSCFYFLAAYCVLILFLATRLPKTGPKPSIHHLHIIAVAKGYWNQLKDPWILAGGTMVGLGTVFVYLFASEAPFIGIGMLKLSPDAFGLYNLIPYIGAAAGPLAATRLAHHRPPFAVIAFGIAIIATFSIVLLITFGYEIINLWTLFGPIAFIYFGVPFEYATTAALSTAQATDKSNASAVLSFLNMLFPVIGVLLLGIIAPQNRLVMPSLFVIITALMIVLYFILRRLGKSHNAR